MTGAPNETRCVAQHMLEDLDGLLGDVASRVWQQVPAYADVLVRVDDLESQVRASLTAILQSFRDDRTLTAAELQRAKETGERRALQGVAQSAIIQSFRNAERSVSKAFLNGCALRNIPTRASLESQHRLIAQLDTLELAMLDAFRAMQEQIATQEVLSEPDLIRRLILGEAIAANEMSHLANVMRLSNAETSLFIGAAATIVNEPAGRTHSLMRLRHRIVAGLQDAIDQPVLSSTVTTGDGAQAAVFTFPLADPQLAVAQLIDRIIAADRQTMDIVSAVGDSYVGLTSAGETCREALSALDVGVHRSSTSETVQYSEVLVEVLIMTAPSLIQKIHERSLGRFQEQSYLQETIQALIDTNLSLSASARHLHVHKNTITYRLRRIEELTGLNVTHPQDLVRMVLSLEGEKLGIVDHDDSGIR